MKRRQILKSGTLTFGMVSIAGCESQPSSSEAEEDDEKTIVTATEDSSEGMTSSGGKIKGEIQEITPQIGGINTTVLEITYDYEGDISPLLVVREEGKELYSDEQVGKDPETVDVSPDVLANGGTYEIRLEYQGKTLAKEETEYGGFELSVQNLSFDGNGTTNGYFLGETNITVKNTGDLPVEIEELQILFAGQPADSVMVVTPQFLPIGKEIEMSGNSTSTMSFGDYDVVVKAIKDDVAIGESSVPVSIEEED